MPRSHFYRKETIYVVILVFFLVLGIYFFSNLNANNKLDNSQNSKSTEAKLSYQLPEGDFDVVIKERGFPLTIDKLVDMSRECGTNKGVDYFTNLYNLFIGSKRVVYSFREVGSPHEFNVSLLPNLPGYKSFEKFAADFDQCYVGGNAYPHKFNQDWLMFISACGTGGNAESAVMSCEALSKQIARTVDFE